ncbi:MAG: EamA family transporter, partial [Vibrio sp.]
MKTLSSIQVFGFTLAAMIAFAANSVLGRLALTDSNLSATTFTAIRLASGAMMLAILVLWRVKSQSVKSQSSNLTEQATPQTWAWLKQGSWLSSAFLAIYALTFSIAYVSLETGTGALILFAAVQICLVLYNMYQGHRLSGM